MNLIPRSFFFDDEFDNFFLTNPRKNEMKCDIYEKDEAYHIEMDIPGFAKEDIKIETKDGHLTIKATKSHEDNEEDKNYIRRERNTSEYQRSFALGDVDIDKIEAKFDKGMLSIIIPKKEIDDNSRMIEIK